MNARCGSSARRKRIAQLVSRYPKHFDAESGYLDKIGSAYQVRFTRASTARAKATCNILEADGGECLALNRRLSGTVARRLNCIPRLSDRRGKITDRLDRACRSPLDGPAKGRAKTGEWAITVMTLFPPSWLAPRPAAAVSNEQGGRFCHRGPPTTTRASSAPVLYTKVTMLNRQDLLQRRGSRCQGGG